MPKKQAGVWIPPHLDTDDGYALQALARGEATPDQQIKALKWIVDKAAMTYDDTFDAANERMSCQMQGRRFVGLCIVQAIKLNLSKLSEMRGENRMPREND